MIVGIGALSVLGLQMGAGAAPGYPGTTTTTVAPAAPTTISISAVVGTSFSGTFCGFSPGATVTLSINGTPDATVAAGSNGCVSFTASVTDPHLALNGGTPVAVPLGGNTITASGTSATGGTISDVENVDVLPAAAPAASASAPLAFTGADIMATVVGGLALIAFGFLVLTFTRRRRASA